MIACGQNYALSQNNSPPTPDEGRRILGQLYELQSCRSESGAYQEYVERDKEQDAREKANYERSLELEKRATALAEKERDLEREKAETYKGMFEAVTKKGIGLGCVMKKVFTLGLGRC